jgi:UDP-N-acetylglucosamine acyltransferase
MANELIHKTAIVEGNIVLGENVKIGPYSYLSGDIQVGSDTEIGTCVRIEGNVRIGRANKIFHSAYIGGFPQDVAFAGGLSFVEIGDNNLIREFVQIHRGTKEGTITKLGSSCFLMAGVHLAHNVKVGNNVTIVNNSMLAGYVEVDDYAFISGLCGFHQFVRVGKYAMIGGLSKIVKDCLPFMTTDGNPAMVAGINAVGLRRREFSPERRRIIKLAYKTIFRSGRNVTQALDELGKLKDNKDIQEIINFINTSARGIIS